ncbi:phosphonate ABC transporter, permease protein PhnE [Paracoccus aestuarii]|uniref:Phosphonate ABC transporter, permease protein PhnE n=1 Tax=Paracoccus aestuarii TaxID=453842 RepID=A0A419A051_9RHOB|nr:phosphonate ABC transporter, permease protein PhnE [Paracoccus aestuarii]RJL06190.1 phosphonate ABC transporter, permease protein PhnE [Paracoccus aestuarii]WCQ98322.1 phosphonate ABC transporter, permease protein PhnE [Paracoccus aestuarii]
MSAATLEARTVALMDRKRRVALAVPAMILAYLIYAAISFDLAGLAQRARLDNAAVLLADAVSHKVHVTRDNRREALSVSVEGSARATYPAKRIPDWIATDGGRTTIALGRGHVVTYDGPVTTYDIPGYGPVTLTVGDEVTLTTPDGITPDFINAGPARVTITTDAGRVTATRARTETLRYFWGWELFFFDLSSPFSGLSPAQVLTTIVAGPPLVEGRSNLSLALSEFWTNDIWQHGAVAWAIFETVLMAFLGTFGAAFVALPLAFLAAQNFTPSRWLRFAVRRVFDFVRGVDALIFTIILSRAFGPGPLTGALAILLTDTGSFGKLFSEALENVDKKPIEGVQSTGANAIQRYRFGVIPQVMPVLISQVLYFLESNTRSATIIGAITGGGIGLMLTQAIQTTQDWEKVTYYILLIVVMVIAMDNLSGWLRRKLIRGD